MNTAAKFNKEHIKAESTGNETKKVKSKDNDSNTKTANIIDESVEKDTNI